MTGSRACGYSCRTCESNAGDYRSGPAKHPQVTFDYSGGPVPSLRVCAPGLRTGFAHRALTLAPGTGFCLLTARSAPLFVSVCTRQIRSLQVSCRFRILISWAQGLEFDWLLSKVDDLGAFAASLRRALIAIGDKLGHTGGPPGHSRPAIASLARWMDERCPHGGSGAPDPPRRNIPRRCPPLPFPATSRVLPRPD